MKELLLKVAKKENLTEQEVIAFVNKVATGQVSESQIAALIFGLRVKGETITERAVLARAMQDLALPIPTKRLHAMDNCGTGGDGTNTFNVSTTAAFVLAGGVSMAIGPFPLNLARQMF